MAHAAMVSPNQILLRVFVRIPITSKLLPPLAFFSYHLNWPIYRIWNTWLLFHLWHMFFLGSQGITTLFSSDLNGCSFWISLQPL
jgi:hypothetical protein